MQPPPTPTRLLATTARSTFESLALLFAQDAPAGRAPAGPAEAAAALGPGAARARVAFAAADRPLAGAVEVALSAGVAAALAGSMLGAHAPTADDRRDAVGELANVVCGHLVSAAAGPAAVFRLEPPAVHVAADPAPPDAAPAGRWQVWLDVEGGVACVALDAPAALFAHADRAAAGRAP